MYTERCEFKKKWWKKTTKQENRSLKTPSDPKKRGGKCGIIMVGLAKSRGTQARCPVPSSGSSGDLFRDSSSGDNDFQGNIKALFVLFMLWIFTVMV